MIKTNFVGVGHVLSVLKKFDDESVDCVLTSPPYYKMREYSAPDVVWKDGWKGQLGQESTIDRFIFHLLEIFSEIKRVLKNDGSCWVVIADTYSNSGGSGSKEHLKKHTQFGKVINPGTAVTPNRVKELPPKCLCLVPERFALGMVDSCGYTLRNSVVWHKPSVTPSSSKDRFTCDVERILFFVKSKKYYFQQSFEPYTSAMNRWGGQTLKADGESDYDKGTGQNTYRNRDMRPNPKGRNRRTVWSVNSERFEGAHYAVFPAKLVDIILKAGCPKDGLVLDPFCGSGTTLLTAKRLGMKYIGIDISREYVEMSKKRLEENK